MLTEVDNTMAGKQILIDLIVFGLPANIQKSLKRNSIDSTLTLRTKLKKFEGEGTQTKSSTYQNSKKSNPPSPTLRSNKFKSKEELSQKSNSKVFNNTKPPKDRFPCSICANMGAPWRFHPEAECWYKDNVVKKESNNISIETPSDKDDIPKN